MTLVFFIEVIKKLLLLIGIMFGEKGYNAVKQTFEYIQTNISNLNVYQLKQL